MINGIYLIGSLRNPQIGQLGIDLRTALPHVEIFNDWWSAGPEADEYWQKHENLQGHNYAQALESHHAKEVFRFDKSHLDRMDAAILVHPSGRSSQREAGYMFGVGKPVWDLYLEEPDRFDVMTQFGNGVYYDIPSLVRDIKLYESNHQPEQYGKSEALEALKEYKLALHRR